MLFSAIVSLLRDVCHYFLESGFF